MKHQQVNVDFWAMVKSMFTYGILTVLGWFMLRLFNTVFTLPRRLRAQQDNIQATLQELQRRYPDMNITEEEIREAEKEMEVWKKEYDQQREEEKAKKISEATPAVEDKKSI